jgi:predicted flap endonuclease-1-like 5' DNA nuclease
MTLLIGQMLGCLIIAAGIGVAVGWFLRQLSAGRLTQQSMDVAAMLRLKEQMLEKVQHQLQIQASEIHILENKVIETEEVGQAASQELASRHNRIEALQEELARRTQQMIVLETREAAGDRQVSEPDAAAVAQSEESRQLHLTNQTLRQTLESNEQERLALHGRLAELEATLTEVTRLRVRVEELEAAQGRVHWLEVQLSDRDAEHRTALHQLNDQLAERDRRIGELEPLAQRLLEHEETRQPWASTHTQTTTYRDDHIAALQEQLAAQDQLHAQMGFDKQLLDERAKQIDDLQRRIQELDARRQDLEHQLLSAGDDKQKEMDRLRKRAVEMQAALRMKTDGGVVPPLQKPRQSEGQLSLLVEQTHAAKERLKDDLSQIHGIGPVFARTLNKMGLYTFSQIANWKPEDIDKVAKKLYTAPDRIKRGNWVNEAKRLHEQKYGQKL